jgi:hypothetical protein
MNVSKLLLAIAVLVPTATFARQWTDDTGQYRREAEYLRHDDEHVWMRDDSGRTFVVALKRLSLADREYVALESGETVTSPQMLLKTLAFRLPRQSSTHEVAGAKTAATAEDSLTKLTGWHCYGGHCYVTMHHHHPSPVPPAPPTSDKRIYTGCYCTFHLVCRDPAPAICGTGAYKFQVGGNVNEYLVRLQYVGTVPTATSSFLLYSVVAPAPLGITYWYFEDPATPKHCYRIYYFSTATGVVLYDHCAQRRFPL